MSTTKILQASLLATAGTAILATAAHAQSSRYGDDVFTYESSPNCATCAAPAPQTRYGAATPAPMGAPVYVDCTQIGTCAPAPVMAQPTTVYTQPAPVYTQPAQTYGTQSYSTQSYGTQSYSQAAPVNCPAGTTAQPDGTCMQTGSSSYSTGSSSYGSGSSYSTGSAMSSGSMADCPAGTTAQPDGTCMQTGSSSYSTGSYSSGASSYTAPSYSGASTMVDCPAGTTAQPDGTCMQGGSATNSYAGSSVEIYQGDASTTANTGYGYSSQGAYGSTDYLPVRK